MEVFETTTDNRCNRMKTRAIAPGIEGKWQWGEVYSHFFQEDKREAKNVEDNRLRAKIGIWRDDGALSSRAEDSKIVQKARQIHTRNFFCLMSSGRDMDVTKDIKYSSGLGEFTNTIHAAPWFRASVGDRYRSSKDSRSDDGKNADDSESSHYELLYEHLVVIAIRRKLSR